MFDKKNIYHSALVKAGPVRAKVTNTVQQSKFPDKPDFLPVEINGKEHLISIENEEISEALNGLKGKMVEIIATGSRGDARVEVNIIEDEPPRSSNTRSSTPRQQYTEPQHSREDELKKARIHLLRAGVLLRDCLKEATRICEDLQLEGDENIRAIGNCLFIEASKNCDIRALPHKLPDAAPARRQPEPEPEPQGNEFDSLEDADDIPF